MGTPEGMKKAHEAVKEKYGFDKDGKSKFHKKTGAIGGASSRSGGFAYLQKHNPALFAEISRRGGIASNKVQGKKVNDKTTKGTEAW